jgi:PHD/YefM family antitoxin component YafN of YafNO toxin-antitoxin module
MKTMTASRVRQNFGQFLDFGIQEPVVIKRQKRALGVFLPMALYRKLVEGENRKVMEAMDQLQAEAGDGGLTESELDGLLEAENPS